MKTKKEFYKIRSVENEAVEKFKQLVKLSKTSHAKTFEKLVNEAFEKNKIEIKKQMLKLFKEGA